MKAGDKVYRAHHTGSRIVVDCATVRSVGAKEVVLSSRMPAWRHQLRVGPGECYSNPATAYEAELARMRDEACDCRESADEMDSQVRVAEKELDAMRKESSR
jgi:hypothetical protein